jgi:hypothetical protein
LPLCHFLTLHLPPQHLCPLSNYFFNHAHIQKTPEPPPGVKLSPCVIGPVRPVETSRCACSRP